MGRLRRPHSGNPNIRTATSRRSGPARPNTRGGPDRTRSGPTRSPAAHTRQPGSPNNRGGRSVQDGQAQPNMEWPISPGGSPNGRPGNPHSRGDRSVQDGIPNNHLARPNPERGMAGRITARPNNHLARPGPHLASPNNHPARPNRTWPGPRANARPGTQRETGDTGWIAWGRNRAARTPDGQSGAVHVARPVAGSGQPHPPGYTHRSITSAAPRMSELRLDTARTSRRAHTRGRPTCPRQTGLPTWNKARPPGTPGRTTMGRPPGRRPGRLG